MEPSSANDLKLSIVGQDNDEVFFLTKRNVPLMKVFQRYCAKKQLEYNTIQFIFDGRRVTGRKTPEMIHMRNNDQIDALMHQDGGGSKGSAFRKTM